MQQQEVTTWHSLEPETILAELRTGLAGLSGSEAADRLQSQGGNLLIRSSGDSPWLMIWRQCNNPSCCTR